MTDLVRTPSKPKSASRKTKSGLRVRTGATPDAQTATASTDRVKGPLRPSASSIVIGGRPSVDLLPTEVLVHRRERSIVRRLWLGVGAVAVIAVLGSAAAGLHANTAANSLASAQAETVSLLQQQQQYREVRTTEASSNLLEAAQAVGGSTEIAWGDYLADVQRALPAGVAITGVAVDSASPMEEYSQADAPLQGARVATLTFDARSATLPSVPDWLDALKGSKGFVDAVANAVTLDPSSGAYTVNMTLHINEAAFDGKYALDGEK